MSSTVSGRSTDIIRYPRLPEQISMHQIAPDQQSRIIPSSITAEEQGEWLKQFRQLDTNNQGYIAMSDLKRRLQSSENLLGLTKDESNRLLSVVDLDNNRKIDYSEFCLLMTRAKALRARHVILRSAQLVTPMSNREEQFNYLEQYNCMPPPIFLLVITVVEIAIYIYYVVKMDSGISISGPVPTSSPLIYDPCCREQAWQYVSYMFIHIGVYHILFNSIAQLALGIPLELVHKFWRVGLVYVLGVLAGSLAVSVTDPQLYLAGASGGVYALIAAHIANLVVNWSEMEFAVMRLVFLVILLGTDLGVALYNRYGNTGQEKVSHVAHLGGFIAGILMGIVVLRNFKRKAWERVVWWIALVGFILLVLFCVFWNIFYSQYCTRPCSRKL